MIDSTLYRLRLPQHPHKIIVWSSCTYLHLKLHVMHLFTLYSKASWVALNQFRREPLDIGDAVTEVHSSESHTCTCDCQGTLCLCVIWRGWNLYSNTSLHNSSIFDPGNIRSREANSRAGEGGSVSHRDHCWRWVLQEKGIDCGRREEEEKRNMYVVLHDHSLNTTIIALAQWLHC